MEWLLANKPAGSILMVDEAYIHLAGGASSMVDMAARTKRSSSFAPSPSCTVWLGCARARQLAVRTYLKNHAYSGGALPVTAMVGAAASLKVKNLVPERRKIIQDVREDVLSFLDKNNFHYVHP